MADEKMKFTFLDDNGKPIEETQTEEVNDGTEGVSGEEAQSNDETTDESTDTTGETEDSANADNGGGNEGGSEGDDSEGEESVGDDNEDEEYVDYSDTDGLDEEDESEEVTSAEEAQDEDNSDVVDYEELPEAVQKYLDFMEDTGGSLQDFVNINQDLSKLPQDEVIGRFLKAKYPTLDGEDINYEIESRFGAEDTDTDADIRRKNVEKKKFYAEALSSLQSGAEKHKVDLASSNALPAQAKAAIDFVKNYETQQAQSTKQLEAVRKSFIKESNKALGKDFKGFEVKVGDETILYKPENFAKVKEQNMNVNNLLNKFLDKDGSVKDISGYHKALSVASNPEGFAQHFFELGKAAMVEEDARDSKNVNTKTRGTQPNLKSKQPKFKFLDAESSSNSKIKLKHY